MLRHIIKITLSSVILLEVYNKMRKVNKYEILYLLIRAIRSEIYMK